MFQAASFVLSLVWKQTWFVHLFRQPLSWMLCPRQLKWTATFTLIFTALTLFCAPAELQANVKNAIGGRGNCHGRQPVSMNRFANTLLRVSGEKNLAEAGNCRRKHLAMRRCLLSRAMRLKWKKFFGSSKAI
jgi:hypothetical protein